MRARSLDEAVAAAAGRHDPASHMLRLAQYERARATGPRLMDRIVSQLLTLFVTPVLYLYLERLSGIGWRPFWISKRHSVQHESDI